MKKIIIITLLNLLLVAFAYAEEKNTLKVYTAPATDKYGKLKYPSDAARNAAEGYVVLSFMVDTDGKVFEPTVIDSTGGRFAKSFEKAAINSLNRTKYKPATFGDETTEAGSTTKYFFKMESDADGATKAFSKEYKKYGEILAADDQQASLAALNQLSSKGVRNLYENAYLNMGHFNFATKYGTTIEQMHYLERALSYEKHGEKKQFLAPEATVLARRKLFELQLTNLFYAEALESYLAFVENDDYEANELFKPAYKQLMQLKTNEDAYELTGTTDENGSWAIDLFKQGFAITSAEGTLNEFKLRCDKKYIMFAYTQDEEYSVPENWGECYFQVLGDANVNFKLVQF